MIRKVKEMMKKFDMRILWGALLIAGGALFLLQELNLVTSAWELIMAALFAVAGVVFLVSYWTDRSQWWPLIPGLGLLSLGALILVDSLFPGIPWTGAIFLGGIGAAFWLVYLLNRENWWAVIPGGVLVTLAVVAGVDPFVGGDAGGGIFFLGLGLTFVLVGLLPSSQGPMRWAFIPAAVLLLMGVFLLTPLTPVLNYIWPVALIVLGLYFILRNMRKGV